MKKAKNILLYTVCIGVILYLAYCVAAMSTSGLAKTADAYFGAVNGMFHGAHLFRNLLLIGAVAWLILSYLEHPVHRRDLSGYVLVLLGVTALWLALRIFGYYDPVFIELPWPIHFAVMIDLFIFVPFLALEAAAFFFLRHRGKQNYPKEYQFEWQKLLNVLPKPNAILAVLLALVVLLGGLSAWCYGSFGYVETLSPIIMMYDVSDDGSYILVMAGNGSGFWYYTDYTVEQSGNALNLTFYRHYGPAYLPIDTTYPCRIDLTPGCTEIRVFNNEFCSYDLYLILDEETDLWKLRAWDYVKSEYVYLGESDIE